MSPTPKISVITPTNNPRFLRETWDSLKAQTFQDYEWVIVPNNECVLPWFDDPHIRVVPMSGEEKAIGAIKRFAFMQGAGEWLLELDHDDILLPTALERLAEVGNCFEFAFSNTANFHNDTWEPDRHNPAYGWKYRDVEYSGHQLVEHRGWEPSPASLRLIYWTPNHFRAWRREFYHYVGGHNDALRVCDDHELVIRTYLKGKMAHIDECLYLYRVVGGDWNSWLTRNREIQDVTRQLQDEYMYQLVERWAELEMLPKVDICGRFSNPYGYISVDLKKASVLADLEKPWPFADSSVGVVRASDALEHLTDPVHTMKEIHRILVPGGYLISRTPSTDGRGAFQDPTHKSWWNQNSFFYWTREEQARYIDNFCVRFQVARLKTDYPNAWCKENNIPYVYADLIALKDGMSRLPGLVEI